MRASLAHGSNWGVGDGGIGEVRTSSGPCQTSGSGGRYRVFASLLTLNASTLGRHWSR